jgi:molybdopterin-guanine dinucleotide biosynthesis protein A
MSAKLSGLILAGGKSSRFGGDKALAALDGRSLLLRASDTLKPLTLDVAISAAPDSAAAAEGRHLGRPVLADRPGLTQGPLLGILAGLEWSRGLGTEWMLSLPCDVVSLPPDTFPRLLPAAAKANGAYAVTADGPQSLCAVWPVSGGKVLEEILLAGSHPPVHEAARRMGAEPLLFEERDVFLNINTKADLRAAEKSFRQTGEAGRGG